MTELQCKRCGSALFVKSGFVRGHQRYRCQECGCNFTNTPPRGKPPAMKALAVLLYAMGNMSLGMIARALGVSTVAVLKWVRAEAASLPEASFEEVAPEMAVALHVADDGLDGGASSQLALDGAVDAALLA